MWTRPPNAKFGPAKKLRSFSEKMPNWNTGIATVCIVRRMRTSAPPVVRAVTSMLYGVIRPIRPWYGPAVIGDPFGFSRSGLPSPAAGRRGLPCRYT